MISTSALNKATQLNPDVNQDSVALMAPYFTSTRNNLERSDIVTWDGPSSRSFDAPDI